MLRTKKTLTGFIHKIRKTLLPNILPWLIINLALVNNAFALQGEGSNKLKNPLVVDSVSELVRAVAEVVMKIGFMVAVVFIIYSGFLYVSARGSEEKLKKAHATFTWTMIGTAVILGAWTIAMVIESTVKSLK